MRTRKSPRLVSTAGAVTLMVQAMMGAALGLIFGLVLVLINPAVAALLSDGGSPTIFVFVITLVTSFAIGATLTGAVFVLMDDKET